MDGVVGDAQEQAVSCGVQGAVCSCSFSVAKAAVPCFLTALLSCCLAEVEGTQTTCYFRPVPGPVSLLLSVNKGVIGVAQVPAV